MFKTKTRNNIVSVRKRGWLQGSRETPCLGEVLFARLTRPPSTPPLCWPQQQGLEPLGLPRVGQAQLWDQQVLAEKTKPKLPPLPSNTQASPS